MHLHVAALNICRWKGQNRHNQQSHTYYKDNEAYSQCGVMYHFPLLSTYEEVGQ